MKWLEIHPHDWGGIALELDFWSMSELSILAGIVVQFTVLWQLDPFFCIELDAVLKKLIV